MRFVLILVSLTVEAIRILQFLHHEVCDKSCAIVPGTVYFFIHIKPNARKSRVRLAVKLRYFLLLILLLLLRLVLRLLLLLLLFILLLL